MPLRPPQRITLFAFCALLALVVSCGSARAPKRPPNVVVIVLDTVRPDYLSAYGHEHATSPYLERFARAGTRFDRAWSTSSWTLPAHASLFSGTLPAYHRATQATEHIAADVPLLAERLRAAGYQSVALSANMWVSRETGLARGFDSFHDEWSFRQRANAPGAQHPFVAALHDWFQRMRKPEKPFFAFVNLTDAHMPYLPHWEEAQPFFKDQAAWQQAINELFPDNGTGLLVREFGGGKKLDERELGELRALYEGALRRVDAVTEALMAQVDANSDPANTLVFVLSDHGENLGEHDQVNHVFNLYETCLRITLLARGPGFEHGSVNERTVQITDVYPTILKQAGLEPEPDCVGLDLLSTLPEQRTLTASLERPEITLGVFPESLRQSGVLARFDHELVAAVEPECKEILAVGGKSRLYDLVRDPGELAALDSLPPTARARLQGALARLQELQFARRNAAIKGAVRQSVHARAGLKDLGYIGEEK